MRPRPSNRTKQYAWSAYNVHQHGYDTQTGYPNGVHESANLDKLEHDWFRRPTILPSLNKFTGPANKDACNLTNIIGS